MVTPESNNKPPQEALPSTNKIGNPRNRAESETLHLHILKPHTSALLGLAPQDEPSPLAQQVPPPNEQVIRKERYERWQQDGYIPLMTGGSERKVPISSQEILELYKKGISVQELAYRFKVSHRTIYKYLHRGGIDDFWAEKRENEEEEFRRSRALELGLDENSTWPEIFAFLDQQDKSKA